MDALTALDRASAHVVDLIGRVDDAQWGLPTPCTEWDVRALVGHLIGGTAGYLALLHGASAEEFRARAHQAAVAARDDATAAAADAREQLRAAFIEPGALERTVHHPMGDLPGSTLLELRIGDDVLHGWDLATALHLPADIDDELAEHVYRTLAPSAEGLAATGYFRPPQRPVDPAAPAQQRLLALVGR